MTATVVGFTDRATATLGLVNHPYVANPDEVTYAIHCGGKPSRLTATPSKHACPYTADFSGTISVPVAQTVTYEWSVSHISEVPGGTLTFTGAGQQTVILPNVTVNTSKVTNSFVVTLRVTSPGGGLSGGTAMCSSIKL